MTTIVWDGTTLAADRLANNNSHPDTMRKIVRSRGHLLGAAGRAGEAMALFAWFEAGAVVKDFPTMDKDSWTLLVAISPDRRITVYENTGFPVILLDKTYAAGSGCDISRGVLAMGGDALKCIEIASRLDIFTGNGIDTLTLEGG